MDASVIEAPNANGRRWARFALVLTLLVSIVANVTHTVLAESVITLWLRVPGAVVWPVLVFFGIEILVRIIWERRWTHSFARAVLLAAALPAAITSYEHQYTLLGMMGERPLIQWVGPIAIDGFMIGCTMALLFTQDRPTPPAPRAPRELLPIVPLVAAEEALQPEQLEERTEEPPVAASRELRERAPRAASGDLQLRVKEMVEQGFPFAVDNKASGASTLRKYAKVARQLYADAAAPVDYAAERVNKDVVESVIRPAMNRERVR